MRDGWMRVVVGCAALVRVVGCGSDFATAGDSSETESSESGSTSSAESMDPSSVSDTLGQTQTSGPPTSDGSTSSDGTSSEGESSTSEEDATTSSSGPPPPFCGDGAVDEGEECDDGDDDDTDDCTTACTLATCGDGFVWAGVEECDDANDVVTDDCPADCVAAFCGDGFIHVGVEECDDVNEDPGDGCAPGCTAESAHLYLMVRESPEELHRYSIDDDAWETIPTGVPGNHTAYSGIASDGEGLYWTLLGSGDLWRFDLADWTTEQLEGPPGFGSHFYNVQWVGGRIYFAPVAPLEDTTAFHVFEDGQWSQFEIGIRTDFCGSWDSVGEELFMGIYPDVGFYVLDTTTNQVVREFEIGIPVSRQLGVYVDGSFYTHDWSGAVYRFDAYDGTYEDTGFTPTSAFPSAALNPATRKIYLAGSQDELDHFEVYDTLDQTVTTLAAPPFDVPTFNAYTSLVLIFPGD